MSKPNEKEIRKAAQEFQNREKGGGDSRRKFYQAGHDARDDYQKAGSPFGPLDKRKQPK
ncbi:MAG: hypothetical protein ACXWIU_08535 [Limisphaerales bacterium]